MKLISFVILFNFVSCASYIDRVHKQIDKAYQEDRNEQQRPQDNEIHGHYRRRPDSRNIQDRRPIKDPVTYKGFSQNPNQAPSQRRDFRASPTKRYTAGDLVDDKPNDESLWAGQGRENYLFSGSSMKRPGDVVIIQVQEDLKDRISRELRKIFPQKKRRKPAVSKDESNKENTGNEEQDKKEEPKVGDTSKDEATDLSGKVYDKISSQVVEDHNNKYVSINGIKEVLFRNKKRVIRIEAMAPKRSINDEDSIYSDQLLETKVYVLR